MRTNVGMYSRFVTFLLLGVLGAALATNAPTRQTPTGPERGQSRPAAETAAVEQEYQKLQTEDDAAQAEVDKWVRESSDLKAKGGGASQAELDRRIRERLGLVRKAYENFLSRHPDHARAQLAYGNFLSDRQDEAGAQAHWEKALELDPKNADAYNNLAGRYSESGPVKKAFEYFDKAIELKPSEPVYYHNFATSLYVLNKQGMKYYGLNEQQVYAKTLQLYSNAAWLAPLNFTFASDLAQTYYSLKPLPADDALKAWTNAVKRAHNELEREEVYVHLARVKMLAGRLREARAQLIAVTNENSAQLKANLLRRIEERENPARATNAPPLVSEQKP